MALPNPKDNPPKAKVKDNPVKGAHNARVVGVTDLGIQPEREWQGKTIEAAHKVEITFELPKSLTLDGRPHWVSKIVPVNFNISDSDPNFTSAMMKIVLAVNPSEEIMDHEILNRIITRVCQVTIGHNKKGYATVDAVTGVPADTYVPDLVNPSFIFDWDTASKEDFAALRSPLTRKRIQEADNYATSQLRARVDGIVIGEELPF